MNKILVPTDFSEHSNYALEYASNISKEKGGKLVILHIAKKENQLGLNDKLSEIKTFKYLQKVDFEIVIKVGSHVSKMINKVAVDLNVDLIIMGSNGISNVGEMLLGSNTENVIRKSKFNVLTIKHQMLDLNIKSILFPSNFSPETYTVFKTVKEFAELFNATIHLLRVNTASHFEGTASVTDKMDMLINHFNLNSEHKKYKKVIYDDKNEELGIINYAIDNDMDMIAIGSHGKNVLHKLIRESTSQNLVRDSFRPVLTIRF